MKLKCRCGVRLDTVEVALPAFEVARRQVLNSRGVCEDDEPIEMDLQPVLLPSQGKRLGERTLNLQRFAGADIPHGGAMAVATSRRSVSYRCRRCGMHHVVKRDRLLSAVKSGLAAGRRVLEFGVDL